MASEREQQVVLQLAAARAAIDAALSLLTQENIIAPPGYRPPPAACKHERTLNSMGGWKQCRDCPAQWQEKG